jgi:hypothetical protein
MTMYSFFLFGRRRSFRATGFVLFIMLVSIFLLACVPRAAAQVSAQGQWQTLPNLMPINPVHAALLHNGKVLIVSGTGNLPSNTNLQAGVFDPATGIVTTQTVNWEMFCNGMVVLPDGRAFVNGGTLQYDPFHGQLRHGARPLVSHGHQSLQRFAHDLFRPRRKR